jgi:predicted dehydrogenase
MKSDVNMNRRAFLLNGAVTLAGASMSGIPQILQAAPLRGKKLAVGIIGTGNRGAGIANIIRRLDGLEVVACSDVLPKNLEKGLAHAGFKAVAYSDYRKLLEDKRVEAVIIATPLHEHYRMAVDAIDAGKHVYVEKTMTYDIDQAISLEKKVMEHPGLVFQVGYQYRYYGLYRRVKEMIDAGWLGDVIQYECQYHRNSNWRNPVTDPSLERQVNWKMYNEYSGGLMSELCSHQIDVLHWFTGSSPLFVSGMGGIDYWKDGRETWDNVRALFEFPGGVKANVSSILSNAYKGYSLRVLGSNATVEIQQNKAYLYPEEKERKLGVVDGVTGATLQSWGQGEPVLVNFGDIHDVSTDPTVFSLLDFVACIRDGKKPFSDVVTGKHSAIAVHKANQAIASRTVQSWKL